jgi:hypothetical protein
MSQPVRASVLYTDGTIEHILLTDLKNDAGRRYES